MYIRNQRKHCCVNYIYCANTPNFHLNGPTYAHASQLTSFLFFFFITRSSFYSGYSSSFSGGGACLSHDHATQFRFVLQSFTLWREIMANMPKLWMLADHDMTHESYRLVKLSFSVVI